MQEARKTVAETSNVLIAANAQRSRKYSATGKPISSIARNARNRGGASLLPMLSVFAMEWERNERARGVQ